MFIKLTNFGHERTYYLNYKKLIKFEKTIDGLTELVIGEEWFVTKVKETPEEIMKLIEEAAKNPLVKDPDIKRGPEGLESMVRSLLENDDNMMNEFQDNVDGVKILNLLGL